MEKRKEIHEHYLNGYIKKMIEIKTNFMKEYSFDAKK